MIGKLKRFKRVAPRCEKTKRNFTSIVVLAAAFILAPVDKFSARQPDRVDMDEAEIAVCGSIISGGETS